ncbi:MAG TPA: hypothetical protein ENN80_03440 [Candidatus Hydrogenedentes bacterium]|nr:hypothetical protein [Candidatus Hydrogenedentota bacterium]
MSDAAKKTVYVVTLWSGSSASKRWKTAGKPGLLPNGAGVSFTDLNTGLSVYAVGPISVEEFEESLEVQRFVPLTSEAPLDEDFTDELP